MCINEDFETARRIAEMPRVVAVRCGFIDNEPSTTKIANHEAELEVKSQELQALRLEIAKLQSEKTIADLQTAHHKEIVAQIKKNCEARIALKVHEISQCSNELSSCTRRSAS